MRSRGRSPNRFQVYAFGAFSLFLWITVFIALSEPSLSLASGERKRPEQINCSHHINHSAVTSYCALANIQWRMGTKLCHKTAKLYEHIRVNEPKLSANREQMLASMTEERIAAARSSLVRIGVTDLTNSEVVLTQQYNDLSVLKEANSAMILALAEQVRRYNRLLRIVKGTRRSDPPQGIFPSCYNDYIAAKDPRADNQKVEMELTARLKQEIEKAKEVLQTYSVPFREKVKELREALDEVPKLKELRIRREQMLANIGSRAVDGNDEVIDYDLEAQNEELPIGGDASLAIMRVNDLEKGGTFAWSDLDEGEKGNFGIFGDLVEGEGKDWNLLLEDEERLITTPPPSLEDTKKLLRQALTEAYGPSFGGWTEEEVTEMAKGLIAGQEKGMWTVNQGLATAYRESTLKKGEIIDTASTKAHGKSYGTFQLNLQNAKYLETMRRQYNIPLPPGISKVGTAENYLKNAMDESRMFEAQLAAAVFHDTANRMKANNINAAHFPNGMPDYLSSFTGKRGDTGIPPGVYMDEKAQLQYVTAGYVAGPVETPRSNGRFLTLMARGFHPDDFAVEVYNKACKDQPNTNRSQCGYPVHLVSCFHDRFNAYMAKQRAMLELKDCRPAYDNTNFNWANYN